MVRGNPARIAAFTLLELSVVVLILSLLAGAAIRYASSIQTPTNNATTNATLNVLDTALYNFRLENGRLPCPANVTMAENVANFGQEVDTTGDGACTGYNFINAHDPDGPTGNCGVACDSGAPDPNYDSTALNQVVAGGVPTRALRLADKYAYDAWGHKILYAVDKRSTAINAFTTYPVYNTTIGAVVVKKAATDLLANAITIKGLYALVSAGPDMHGGYVRISTPSSSITGCVTTAGATYGTSCSVAFNGGSTNTDEQDNCHCSSSGVATSFNRIFVQNTPNITNGGANSILFDDIVRFKTRAELASNAEMSR